MIHLQKGLANVIRSTGQALDSLGKNFEASPYTDKLLPSINGVKLGKSVPELKNLSFISPSSAIIGKVAIASETSVWYGAIIRGDVNTIKIGEKVTIGDRVVIHCAGISKNFPTVIGDNVLLGTGSILHGCTVESESVIGEGAQVMDGATVSAKAILLPGALLPPGKVIPSGQVWGGVPAKYVRDVTEADLASLQAVLQENFELALEYQKEVNKTWQTVEQDEDDYEETVNRADYYHQRLPPEEWSDREGEIEGHTIPGRIFDSDVSGRTRAGAK